jgi:hypothetical protein
MKYNNLIRLTATDNPDPQYAETAIYIAGFVHGLKTSTDGRLTDFYHSDWNGERDN